jgi:hypothetical protein
MRDRGQKLKKLMPYSRASSPLAKLWIFSNLASSSSSRCIAIKHGRPRWTLSWTPAPVPVSHGNGVEGGMERGVWAARARGERGWPISGQEIVARPGPNNPRAPHGPPYPLRHQCPIRAPYPLPPTPCPSPQRPGAWYFISPLPSPPPIL